MTSNKFHSVMWLLYQSPEIVFKIVKGISFQASAGLGYSELSTFFQWFLALLIRFVLFRNYIENGLIPDGYVKSETGLHGKYSFCPFLSVSLSLGTESANTRDVNKTRANI